MILVYYHNDLDGICSAAIIIKKFGADDVKCIPVQYNGDTWDKEEVEQAESVYIVDFTFPDMDELIKVAGRKLRWIDHHKTAMEQHPVIWDSTEILGIRDLDRSGCGLTWWYCFEYTIPYSVRYVEDRDLWRFFFEDTKAFCAGANAILSDPYNEEWGSLLEPACVSAMCRIIDIGTVLIQSQERRVEYLFKSGIDTEFHGHAARIVNTTSDISELGEYIYKKPEYEIAVMWQVIGDKMIVSLRSDSIDCAEIAQMYGGGGHRGAAGFQVDNVAGFPMKLL